jgi:LPXTG-motif cell wall-anchored protein
MIAFDRAAMSRRDVLTGLTGLGIPLFPTGTTPEGFATPPPVQLIDFTTAANILTAAGAKMVPTPKPMAYTPAPVAYVAPSSGPSTTTIALILGGVAAAAGAFLYMRRK